MAPPLPVNMVPIPPLIPFDDVIELIVQFCCGDICTDFGSPSTVDVQLSGLLESTRIGTIILKCSNNNLNTCFTITSD